MALEDAKITDAEMIAEADVFLDEAAAMLAAMPSAIAAAIVERNRDFISHHKKTVLKSLRFKSGDRAQRMIASRMFGYAQLADVLRTGKISDAQGESFVASREDVPQLTKRALLTWENGATVTGSEWMAVPVGDGLPYRGVFATRAIWQGKNGQNLLEASRDAAASGGNPRFVMRYSPLLKSVLILDRGTERAQRSLARRGQAPMMRLVGIMTRRRKQPATMGVMAAAQKILPRHMEKMSQAVAFASTAAGEAATLERLASVLAQRRAFTTNFRRYLDASPKDFAGARRAGARAKAMVRAARIAKGQR